MKSPEYNALEEQKVAGMKAKLLQAGFPKSLVDNMSSTEVKAQAEAISKRRLEKQQIDEMRQKLINSGFDAKLVSEMMIEELENHTKAIADKEPKDVARLLENGFTGQMIQKMSREEFRKHLEAVKKKELDKNPEVISMREKLRRNGFDQSVEGMSIEELKSHVNAITEKEKKEEESKEEASEEEKLLITRMESLQYPPAVIKEKSVKEMKEIVIKQIEYKKTQEEKDEDEEFEKTFNRFQAQLTPEDDQPLNERAVKLGLPEIFIKRLKQQNFSQEQWEKLSLKEIIEVLRYKTQNHNTENSEKEVKDKKEGEKVDGQKEDVKKEKLKFQVGVVDAMAIAEAKAWDLAARHMTESKEQRGKGLWDRVKRIGRNIWKHNFFQGYYEQKKQRELLNEILWSKNIHKDDAMDRENFDSLLADAKTKEALAKRFISEFDKEVLSQAEQDSKRKLSESNPEEKRVIDSIKTLALRYAKGEISEMDFESEKIELLRPIDPKIADRDGVYADNILELAKNIKEAYEHNKGLTENDFEIDIILGKAESKLHTKGKESSYGEFRKKLTEKGLGKLFNNELTANAVAIAFGIGTKVIGGASRNLANLVTLGGSFIFSGAVRARKENARLKKERAQHQRERAMGLSYDEQAKRRIDMEQFTMKMESAEVLIASLESDLESLKNGTASFEKNDEGKQNHITSILGRIADTEARIKFMYDENIDLISYSDGSGIEATRTQLDILRGQLKAELKTKLIEPKNKDALGGKSLDLYLVEVGAGKLQEFKGELTAKDQAFTKWKKKEVINKGFYGIPGFFGNKEKRKQAAINVAGFFVGQEAAATLTGWLTGQDGVIQGALKNNEHLAGHATYFESLRRWVLGDNPTEVHSFNPADMVDTKISLGGIEHAISLPSNIHIEPIPGVNPPEYNFVTADGILVNDKPIHLNLINGKLSHESIQDLENEGIVIKENTIDGQPEMTTVSAKEYMENNPNAVHMKRGEWYDNNTPKPHFEKGELKLDFNNKPVDGKYAFDISRMRPGDSFHGPLSADAMQLAKEGKLVMAFSLSKDSQSMVFTVPINEQGQALIDPTTEVGKAILEVNPENGIASPAYQYAEVVDIRDGMDNAKILATEVGPGRATIETLTAGSKTPHTTFEINKFKEGSETGWVTDPWIFFLGRKPLERMYYTEKKQKKAIEEIDTAIKQTANPVLKEELQKEKEKVEEKLKETQKEIIEKEAKLTHVGTVMTANPVGLATDLMLETYAKDPNKKARFYIFEIDPSKREAFKKEIALQKEKYPNAEFIYVELSSENTSEMQKTDPYNYMQKNILALLKKQNVEIDVIRISGIRSYKQLNEDPFKKLNDSEAKTDKSETTVTNNEENPSRINIIMPEDNTKNLATGKNTPGGIYIQKPENETIKDEEKTSNIEETLIQDAEEKETKKDFDSLTVEEISNFIGSIPRVRENPNDPTSRGTMIDPSILKTTSGKDLNEKYVGQEVILLDARTNTFPAPYVKAIVLAPDLSKPQIGQTRVQYEDGSIGVISMGQTYLLEDVKKAYQNKE